MKASVISLALLGLVGCASSENVQGEDVPGGGGDGDSESIEGQDLGDGETIEAKNLIDDLEDNDDSIKEQGGRKGSWYTFHDDESGDSAEQTPDPDKFKASEADGDNKSKYVAATKGKGFVSYAGLALDLNSDGSEKEGEPKGTFDASDFEGISFIARGPGDLRFAIATPATTNEKEGGSCTAGDSKCDDTHGVEIALESDWLQYDIPFSALKQEGWGLEADFDPKKIIGITFSVPEKATFDFAIDDVGFY